MRELQAKGVLSSSVLLHDTQQDDHLDPFVNPSPRTSSESIFANSFSEISVCPSSVSQKQGLYSRF